MKIEGIIVYENDCFQKLYIFQSKCLVTTSSIVNGRKISHGIAISFVRKPLGEYGSRLSLAVTRFILSKIVAIKRMDTNNLSSLMTFNRSPIMPIRLIIQKRLIYTHCMLLL